MSEPIWMYHAETGNYGQFPDGPFWRAAGWEPSDPPPPQDTTKDPAPEAPAEQFKPRAAKPAASEKE
jgi:hypothetical protein